MAELLEFDPVSEDAANSPLSVMNASYRVLAHAYPAPKMNVLYASSIDTEGELAASRRPSNREISMSIEMVDTTGSLTRALQAKVAKIAREGGTLKRTLTTGQVIVFDLLSAEQFDPSFDIAYYSSGLVKVDLLFGAKPFGRGAEVALSSHSETTLPCLMFTETGLAGDVDGLGRLVITDGSGADQGWVSWGMQSRYYSSATTAGLFYQAEALTPLGSSSVTGSVTGASGSSVLTAHGLASTSQEVLSTQIVSGGAHMTHVGDFAVFARMRISAPFTLGQASVSLLWSQGDFLNWVQNDAATMPASLAGQWQHVALGLIHLDPVVHGGQQWQGRLIAQSTIAGDDLDVDCLYLMPIERSGRASRVTRAAAPTGLTARDEFDQASSALSGVTAPLGGAWSTSGSTGDFTIGDTSSSVAFDPVLHTAKRGANDNTGRFAVIGSAVTSCAAQVDVKRGQGSNGTFAGGVLARYSSSSNWLRATTDPGTRINIHKNVAGTQTQITSGAIPGATVNVKSTGVTIQMQVSASGNVVVYAGITGGALSQIAAFYDADLATGGALASGKVGMYDSGMLGGVGARNYDNFVAWTPVGDAAMFGSQKLEIQSSRVLRTDTTGTTWQRPSSYEGNYLTVPPAGAEGRSARFFIKASRNPPGTVLPDAAIDDISAQLFYTPRYLVIP